MLGYIARAVGCIFEYKEQEITRSVAYLQYIACQGLFELLFQIQNDTDKTLLHYQSIFQPTPFFILSFHFTYFHQIHGPAMLLQQWVD